jgi:hypothetical protein
VGGGHIIDMIMCGNLFLGITGLNIVTDNPGGVTEMVSVLINDELI